MAIYEHLHDQIELNCVIIYQFFGNLGAKVSLKGGYCCSNEHKNHGCT